MRRLLAAIGLLALSGCSLDPLFTPGPGAQPSYSRLPPPAPSPRVPGPAAPAATPAPPPAVPRQAPPPAVAALMAQAVEDRRHGDLDQAAGRLERALRIQPDDPRLWYELARVRLEQGQPRLAEELAKKSLQLAGGDEALRRQDWRLIAEARRRSGDPVGAREAERRAAGH